MNIVRDSISALPPGEMFSLMKSLFKDDRPLSLKSSRSLTASDLAQASPSAPLLWRMLFRICRTGVFKSAADLEASLRLGSVRALGERNLRRDAGHKFLK